MGQKHETEFTCILKETKQAILNFHLHNEQLFFVGGGGMRVTEWYFLVYFLNINMILNSSHQQMSSYL